jgi:hypothetical protein
MVASKTPRLDATTLRQRLALLRRGWRRVTVFRGTAYLLALVLTAAALVGAMDWRWHLPDLVRGVALVGTLAGAAVIAYRYLFRPLRTPVDDLSLALRIEDKFPHLNDALASTVEFLDREGRPEGESSALEREAVRRALGRVTGIDFRKIIDTRGLRKAGLGAAHGRGRRGGAGGAAPLGRADRPGPPGRPLWRPRLAAPDADRGGRAPPADRAK